MSEEIKLTLKDSLKNLIEKNTVISFDIFDTLVFRPFLRPIDVFYQMEYDLQVHGFAQERIRAEMTKREQIINGGKDVEITFEDIYTEIDSKYKDLSSVELEYELKYCLPNPIMIEIYQYAIAYKKHVAITSDMYLPASTIRNILNKAGVFDYEHLLLSCDQKISKADKSSYRYLKKLYSSINNNNILHIGDNYQTDYLNAQEEGINTFHYENVHEQLIKKSFLTQEFFNNIFEKNDLAFSRYYGFLSIQYALNLEQNDIKKLAAEIVLPIVTSFNQELYQYCLKNDINKILFASRDGYIFKENFDQCFKTENIQTQKLYVSRRVCVLPVMEFDSINDYSTWAQGMENTTPLELWENLEIEDEKLKLSFLNFATLGDRSTHHGVMTIYENFFREYGYFLKKKYKQESSTLMKYLESLDYFSHKTVVVELGWSGSLQNAIHKLASNHGKIVFPKWYYLATRDDAHIRIKKDTEGYLMNLGQPKYLQKVIGSGVDFLELLFTAPCYGVKFLQWKDNILIEPQFFEKNEEEDKRIEISKEIYKECSFCIKNYLDFHNDFMPLTKVTQQNILIDYVENLDTHSRELFSEIKTSANFKNTNYQPLYYEKLKVEK